MPLKVQPLLSAGRLFSEARVNRYIGFLVRRRYAVLGVCVLLAAAGLYLVRTLSIDSSVMALLPADTPSVRRVKMIEAKTGGFGDLIVMLESPCTDSAVAVAEKILPEIRRLPWVGQASYKTDYRFFRKNMLLYVSVADLEEIRDRVAAYIHSKQKAYNPFLVDLVGGEESSLDFSDIEKKYSGAGGTHINLNADGTILCIVVRPNGTTSDIAFTRNIIGDMERIVARFDTAAAASSVALSVGGTYRNRLEEYRSIVYNVKSSMLVGATVILLLLLLYFRNPWHLVALLVPLLSSIIITFAVTAVTIGELNLITAFLVIVLFGLGIDFGIHLLTRYRGQLRQGRSHDEALAVAVLHGGKSCLSAALTTLAAFAMLTFSNFLGFRHFGFIAGIGVITAYVAYMVLLPVLLTILNDFSPYRRKGAVPVFGPQDIAPVGERRGAVAVLAICCAVTGFMLWQARTCTFENDFRNLRARVPATRAFNAKVNTIFREARDPAAILVRDEQEAREVTRYLQEHNLSDTASPLESVKSVLTVVPDSQEAKLAVIRDIAAMIDRYRPAMDSVQRVRIDSMTSMLVDRPVTLDDIPPGIAALFTGKDDPPGQLVYLYQRKSLLDLNNARDFAQAVGAIRIGAKVYHAVSEPLVYIDLITLVERDSVIAIAGAFILIFLLVFFNTGALRATLLIMSTLIVGSFWMVGTMALFGVRFNLFNLVIFPCMLGLAVDSAIHIFDRFEEQGGSLRREGFLETGAATVMSTLTTLVGFGSFFFGRDPHPGLQSIGITAIIGMSTFLAVSLTYLPAMAVLTRKERR